MPQNLKQITSVRFFAAMWVVAYHFWPSLNPILPALVSRGYLGVELFFVLSGFILSHVYLESFGERRFRYPDFLWARLSRIYPVHLATLAGLGLLVGAAAWLGLRSVSHLPSIRLGGLAFSEPPPFGGRFRPGAHCGPLSFLRAAHG